MRKNVMILTMLLISVLSVAGFAQDEKEENTVTSVSKELEGEISWLNDKYIAIVFNRDLQKGVEEEILLPLDKHIRLERKKSMSEIAAGDTVSIQYDEDIEEDSKGAKKESRKARVIRFVKPGIKKPSMADTGVGTSEDAFPFKGAKQENDPI